MRHDSGLKFEFDGDPLTRAARPCAPMFTMTMTTKTSRRAAGVM
jgi:hypothetical protein